MTDLQYRFTCAILAGMFTVLLLVALFILGGHEARVATLCAALLAIVSQFSAQGWGRTAVMFHLAVSYLGFLAALLAIVLFAVGR